MSPIPSWLRPLLVPASAGYYTVQKLREKAYQSGLVSSVEVPVPVVSVGNLLMGGSGKTPFVIYLAGKLHDLGMRPAVVSRGYRGTNRKPYLVVSDGRSPEPLATPSASGDEPFLLATRLAKIPVVVGRRRFHAVRAARKLFGCDLVVLDDGFQHLPLKRNVDIVLLNGTEDRMFPLGSLREPLSALRRAHMVVLVGRGAVVVDAAKPFLSGLPLFRCHHEPEGLVTQGTDSLLAPGLHAGQEVALMSAIANPDRFRATADDLQWRVLHHFVFPDHHAFRDSELRDVLGRASGVPLVVTEKDWVKLPTWFRERDRTMALRIGVTLEDEKIFFYHLMDLIKQT